MNLICHEEQLAKLREIDEWGKAAGERLGCKGEYKGLLTEDKSGATLVKMKVNTAGRAIAGIYGASGLIPWTKELGDELRGALVRPVILVNKVWSSGAMFGITAELKIARVELQCDMECPEFL